MKRLRQPKMALRSARLDKKNKTRSLQNCEQITERVRRIPVPSADWGKGYGLMVEGS